MNNQRDRILAALCKEGEIETLSPQDHLARIMNRSHSQPTSQMSAKDFLPQYHPPADSYETNRLRTLDYIAKLKAKETEKKEKEQRAQQFSKGLLGG